jgi:hypothetical protein
MPFRSAYDCERTRNLHFRRKPSLGRGSSSRLLNSSLFAHPLLAPATRRPCIIAIALAWICGNGNLLSRLLSYITMVLQAGCRASCHMRENCQRMSICPSVKRNATIVCYRRISQSCHAGNGQILICPYHIATKQESTTLALSKAMASTLDSLRMPAVLQALQRVRRADGYLRSAQ